MQITTNEATAKPKFRPIKVEITFESKNELLILWHHLNLSKTELLAVASSTYSVPVGTSLHDLWNHIDDLIASSDG